MADAQRPTESTDEHAAEPTHGRDSIHAMNLRSTRDVEDDGDGRDAQ